MQPYMLPIQFVISNMCWKLFYSSHLICGVQELALTTSCQREIQWNNNMTGQFRLTCLFHTKGLYMILPTFSTRRNVYKLVKYELEMLWILNKHRQILHLTVKTLRGKPKINNNNPSRMHPWPYICLTILPSWFLL